MDRQYGRFAPLARQAGVARSAPLPMSRLVLPLEAESGLCRATGSYRS